MEDFSRTVAFIREKTDGMMARLDPHRPLMPRPISKDGKYTDHMETLLQPGWTYSFFLATVAYMYICFKEEKYLEFLKACKGPYTDYLFHNDAEIGHDTGFLYSLYAVAMCKLTGEDAYRQLALKAADEVAKRIRLKPGHIQAFFDLRRRGVQDEVSLMIVDDMMNMHLLMWAYKETGHSFYRDVYETHIATAVRNLIRSDYSVCHAYHFDVRTGMPVCEMNYCGFTVGSHWARGTAWMIYGLTKALAFTGDRERYLPPLAGVAAKYLECLEGGVIPVWDFRLPADAENRCRDTSAAAIVASAFLELPGLGVEGCVFEKAYAYAAAVTAELCGGGWLAGKGDEYILNYGNNEGSAWGDYFFTELVMKQQLKEQFVDFWI